MIGDLKEQNAFGKKLNDVLSPSRAIDQERHLKGRKEALKETTQAFTAQGRQVFVHGFRGVGKSSVALTAARSMSPDREPVLVFCSPKSTFYALIKDMAARADALDPFVVESKSEKTVQAEGKVGFTSIGVSAQGRYVESELRKGVPTPSSVNEAAEIFRAIIAAHPHSVFILDEFDLLEDKPSHQLFGEFVKLLADSGVNAKIIFCGVAENLDQIFQAHPSTFRIFHPLKLDQLKLQPCLDIISDAEAALGVEIEHNSKMRIVQISDGFPYFVHLITEKLLWRWFNDPEKNLKRTAPRHYETALHDACAAAEPELKQGYDAVARKHKSDGEIVLWALAEGSQLQKNTDTVYKDFQSIYDRVPTRLKPDACLGRSQVNSRLNNMKREAYRHIVQGNGRGWFEFSEKRMRGYARLRAAALSIELKADHPRA